MLLLLVDGDDCQYGARATCFCTGDEEIVVTNARDGSMPCRVDEYYGAVGGAAGITGIVLLGSGPRLTPMRTAAGLALVNRSIPGDCGLKLLAALVTVLT